MGLQHKVFISKRPSATRTGPAGSDHLKWVPTSSTLIYGERDAVLVDTQLTVQAAKELTDWVIASGKNLAAIYVTHSHGDHHFGSSTVLQQFPSAKVLATPDVASRMESEHSPERLQADEFELEGETFVIVRLGHIDCDETTALWVPSIGLLVTGDSVYGNTHPYMGESGTIESRLAWIAAVDKLATLNPKVVVGGHSDPNSSFGPDAISETKMYFENFNRVAEESNTAEEVYSRMMELYPARLNPGSLWGGAALSKRK